MSFEKISIVNRYQVGRLIGSGSFGDIYVGVDIHTHEEVAIKIENTNAVKCPQLPVEADLLSKLKMGSGIPKVHYSGKQGFYNVMVMDLLGPSLEDLFGYCSRQFTLKTVLLLAEQMLSRIEFVHKHHHIHRDIKPDNFLMGLGKQGNIVYLIDYGLAREYYEPRTRRHIDYKENKSLCGTARYASVNTHKGIEQSRRDDLEALGYVLMYFIRGSLPWQGMRAVNKRQKYEKIREKKLNTPVEELCLGHPSEFADYINICRSYKFDETPDYNALRRLFQELFSKKGYIYDYVYDWNKPHSMTSQQCKEPNASLHPPPLLNSSQKYL